MSCLPPPNHWRLSYDQPRPSQNQPKLSQNQPRLSKGQRRLSQDHRRLGRTASGIYWRNEARGALTSLAGTIVGRRHAHLREAWAADLVGDPDNGATPSASRQLRLAGGDLVAALKCRADDLVAAVWHPVDVLLASWRGSLSALVAPVAVASAMITAHEGIYGLVTNAENLTCIATASYLALKGLRAYRQITTPKRPPKKTKSGVGSGD